MPMWRVDVSLTGVVRSEAADEEAAEQVVLDALLELVEGGSPLGKVYDGTCKAATAGPVETHTLHPNNARGSVNLGSPGAG